MKKLLMPRPNARQKLLFRSKVKYIIFGGARGGGKKARELAKLMEASDEIETALLTAAKAFRAKMLEDESGTLLTDGKFRAGNLGSVVNAIGRQTETRKTLAGLLADDRKENGVTVELAPETRELAD